MRMKEEIKKKLEAFKTLCKMHSVKSLYAFGSAISDNFNDQTSDIDFVVEIDTEDPIDRGEKLMSLWDSFELFFHRKVDLLTDASIKNPILRQSIDSTKELIYDGRGEKVYI